MNDIPDILDGLRRAPSVLKEMLRTVPEARLREKRTTDAWTIEEHAAHLARVQAMLAERVERILTEDNPALTPFIPGKDDAAAPAMGAEEALTVFTRRRAEIVKRLEGASPEDWKRGAIHPEYDEYGLYILARHAFFHDYWHMYRMEELWIDKVVY